jgi:hypothetical protein
MVKRAAMCLFGNAGDLVAVQKSGTFVLLSHSTADGRTKGAWAPQKGMGDTVGHRLVLN